MTRNDTIMEILQLEDEELKKEEINIKAIW